jgi:hypothetical protein
MRITTRAKPRIEPLLLLLPGLYAATVLLTFALSLDTPGGAYYRIIAVNPLAALFMWRVQNDIALTAVFLVIGLPWWYLVGRIGSEGTRRSYSRLRLGLGALFCASILLLGSSVTIDTLKQDARDNFVTGAVMLQYALVAALCVGAGISTLCAVIGAFESRPDTSQP